MALVVIGIYAIHRGPSFMFDPGIPPEPHEAIYYLIVGVVMMINGFIHSAPLFEGTGTEQSGN